MDPESKKLLKETFSLAQKNNKMLHKVRRVQKWATLWHTLKFLIIIGITLGLFYYIEPYLNKILDLYNSISNTEQKLNNIGSVSDILKNIGN